MDFSNKLVNWYQVNKRDLPWRNTANAYYIWLSEIILQQTRVAQGMPYYLAFVKVFPKVEDLANASEDEVLKMWQGLGWVIIPELEICILLLKILLIIMMECSQRIIGKY